MFGWRLYCLSNQNVGMKRFKRKQFILSVSVLISSLLMVIFLVAKQSRLINQMVGIDQSIICWCVVGTFKWHKCISSQPIHMTSQHMMHNIECQDQTDEATLIEIFELE